MDEQHFSDSLSEMIKTRSIRVMIFAVALILQLTLVSSQSQVGKNPLPCLQLSHLISGYRSFLIFPNFESYDQVLSALIAEYLKAILIT